MNKNWTNRDLRKAAFAIGVGFTMGEYIGDVLNKVIDTAVFGTIAQVLAERVNKQMQDVCDRHHIRYRRDEKTEEE